MTSGPSNQTPLTSAEIDAYLTCSARYANTQIARMRHGLIVPVEVLDTVAVPNELPQDVLDYGLDLDAYDTVRRHLDVTGWDADASLELARERLCKLIELNAEGSDNPESPMWLSSLPDQEVVENRTYAVLELTVRILGDLVMHPEAFR